jgi:hypothetical protein
MCQTYFSESLRTLLEPYYNWFTSLESLDFVRSTGNHCLGTVRGNRANIPKEKDVWGYSERVGNKRKRKPSRGDAKQMRTKTERGFDAFSVLDG